MTVWGFCGSPDWKRFRARDELLQKFSGDLALHDDAARVQADLALVEERAERRRADGIVHVHVIQDDHWVVPTELHRGSLERLARALREHPSGLHPTDQVDDANLGTLEEHVSDLGSPTRSMCHDIYDTFGEPSFLHDLRQNQARRDGRELRGLHNDCVARRDRRDDGAPR